MATVRTLIGYIKGPKGDTGATGATGAQGPAGNDGAPGVTNYASTSTAGLVRVGDDFNINSSNGALSIKNAFTEASSLANINTGESQATILGKIKKFMTTLMPSNFLINTVDNTATDKALTANMGKALNDAKLAKASVVNNLTTTEEGYALDARQANPNVSGTLAERVYALGTNTKIKSLAISANANTVFSVSNGTRALLVCYNASAASRGEYIINANSSGTISSTAVLAASALTITGSTTNTLTLANSGSAIAGYAIIFTGDINVQP